MKAMRSLFARLLSVQLAVVLIALLTVAVSLSYLYTQYIFNQKAQDMVRIGQRLATEIALSNFFGGVSSQQRSRLTALLESAQTFGEFIWIDVVDTEGVFRYPDTSGEKRLSQEETEALLSGNIITKRAYVEQLGEPTFAVGVPIITGFRNVTGAVLLHSRLVGILQTVDGARRFIFWSALSAAALAAMVSYLFARRVAGPLQEMRSVAAEISGGNFDRRLPVEGDDEVAELAEALNDMAAKLGSTIAALAEEKSKTDLVVTGLSEGVMALDNEGNIHLANDAARLLLSPMHLQVGQPPERTEATGELGDRLIAAFSQTLAGFGRQQFTVESPDRSVFVQISPLSGPAESDTGIPVPAGAVALLRDVSESQRLEKMRRDFVADVSHELRMPLTSIRGFAQAILEGVVTSKEDVQRYMGIIMNESMRLMRLTNTLLDLSRLDAHRVKLQIAHVPVPDIISDALASLEPIISEKQVIITQSIAPNMPAVNADPDRLEQVLVNLLDNAIRHVGQGEDIKLVAQPVPPEKGDKADWIEMRIEDSGPGIPPAELPFIWERFYKADKARRQNRTGGTGLGLVIVKQIIELHGGNVRAENRLEGGARFVIRLPIAGPSLLEPYTS